MGDVIFEPWLEEGSLNAKRRPPQREAGADAFADANYSNSSVRKDATPVVSSTMIISMVSKSTRLRLGMPGA